VNGLTTSDKVRRVVITLFVVACVAGLGVAIASTREIDDRGEEVPGADGRDDVTLSGDEEALGTVPPPPDDDDTGFDDVVEVLFPPRDSEQLQQVQAGIDLGNRYTAVLVVNGIEVPESQLVRRPETNQVFFTPGDDLVLEAWAPGRNCVQAVVWEITGSRDDSRTVDWCFEVT